MTRWAVVWAVSQSVPELRQPLVFLAAQGLTLAPRGAREFGSRLAAHNVARDVHGTVVPLGIATEHYVWVMDRWREQ